MNLLITGSNGFVGKALAGRLLDRASPGLAVDHVTLLDLSQSRAASTRVTPLIGSFGDAALLAQAFERPVDVIFHLASVPGGAAEQDYELGRRVNLDATVALLEAAAAQTQTCGKRPAFVFASSIAVFGAPLPSRVDDATPPHPQLTYGAHKLVGEILLADCDRRGWVHGRSLRLPGVVARPPQRTGQLSAFMSDAIRELSAGRPFICPVSADSTLWLMSVHCALDNLLHAALLTPRHCGDARSWTLPALRCSIAELVDAIGAAGGTDARSLIEYRPSPALEANFGRHPPLLTPAAEALGFRHDGALTTLVRRALEPV
jgi:nucleoside-diphosphate-sugar epimerase